MPDLLPVFPDHTYCRIEDALNKALDCPQCYAHRSFLIVMSEKVITKPRYLISCTQCNYRGPFSKHISHAVKRWNDPPSLVATVQKWLRKRFVPKHTIAARHFMTRQIP
jgi:hypothetical protein